MLRASYQPQIVTRSGKLVSDLPLFPVYLFSNLEQNRIKMTTFIELKHLPKSTKVVQLVLPGTRLTVAKMELPLRTEKNHG